MRLLRHMGRLRDFIPQGARERLYEWHPGRARRWRRYPGIERVGPGQAVITFDDGPDTDATPAVLEALDRAGVRATFFLLGSQVKAHPELAAEVVRRGHEVGLHGFDHHRHDRIAADVSREDLTRGLAVLEDVLATPCRFYRPPYGKMSDASFDTCRELGVTPVYWSAWGLDWETVSAQRIATVACEQLDDGGILLLHDSARYARRPTATPTAQAVAPIAAWARDHQIRLVTLGEAQARKAQAPT